MLRFWHKPTYPPPNSQFLIPHFLIPVMTPRQRAFCLAYLACPDAPRAARAAGYAPTVAATNAARILSAQPVQAWLEHQRRRRCIVTLQDLELQAQRCRSVLQDPASSLRDCLRASAELRHIARCADKLPPEAQALSAQDEAELAAAFAQAHTPPGPTSPDKIEGQMPEDEPVAKQEKTAEPATCTATELPEPAQPQQPGQSGAALRQNFARLSLDYHRQECRRMKEENLKANLDLKARYLNHLHAMGR